MKLKRVINVESTTTTITANKVIPEQGRTNQFGGNNNHLETKYIRLTSAYDIFINFEGIEKNVLCSL
ncbi:hypothetical protein J2T20_002944 [Paenibacillus wynnii]|nr:hypothetical protein [Paenibacillus wynnii]